MPLPLLALLAPSIISGVSSVVGGAKTAGAANAAGAMQQKAADEEAAKILAAAETGSTDIRNASGTAANDVIGAGDKASDQILGYGNEGIARILQALSSLDQYESAGGDALSRILAGLQEGGEFSQQFNFDPSQFVNDAGVNFRKQQGRKAIENRAASRGLIGGNTVRATEEFAQGVASDEFNRAFDRGLTTFQTNRNNALNPLMALADQGRQATGAKIAGTTAAGQLGLSAATNSADALMGAATTAGNFRVGGETEAARMRQNAMLAAAGIKTDGAAAAAGGKVGASNAFQAALQGIAGAVTDAVDAYGNRKP
jgi:hypothetical protein